MNIQNNPVPENLWFRTDEGIDILVKGDRRELTKETYKAFVKEALEIVQQFITEPNKTLSEDEKLANRYSKNPTVPSLRGKFVVFNFDASGALESIRIRPLDLADEREKGLKEKIEAKERLIAMKENMLRM